MKKSGLRALLMLLILGLETIEIRGQAPAVDTTFALTDSGTPGDAGPELGKVIADSQADNLSLLGKVALGTFVFAMVEGGILIYSGAFANHPLGGSALMAVSGLVAAVNANGPSGSKITVLMAGGMIAYNLLRFGIESPSEDRSVRIFTENVIVMNTAILAGIFYPRPKTNKTSASIGNALTVHASRGGIGLAKAWEF